MVVVQDFSSLTLTVKSKSKIMQMMEGSEDLNQSKTFAKFNYAHVPPQAVDVANNQGKTAEEILKSNNLLGILNALPSRFGRGGMLPNDICFVMV